MREMLDEKLKRFEELEASLSDPEVQGNSSKMAAVAREHGSLAKLATKYRKFQTVIGEIDEVREMAKSSDPEEREMAEEELKSLLETRETLWDELLDMTVGGEDANRSRCVMEFAPELAETKRLCLPTIFMRCIRNIARTRSGSSLL